MKKETVDFVKIIYANLPKKSRILLEKEFEIHDDKDLEEHLNFLEDIEVDFDSAEIIPKDFEYHGYAGLLNFNSYTLSEIN